MKWKFCSDGDCPPWALATLHSVSSLPADVFRRVVDHTMKDAGECRDDDRVIKILKGTHLGDRDSSARTIAFVRWCCTNALRSNCTPQTFAQELGSLGMPRVSANLLANAVREQHDMYIQRVNEHLMLMNRVVDVKVSEAPEDTVDCIQLELTTKDYRINDSSNKSVIIISIDKAKELLVELRKAQRYVDILSRNKES